jgi:hypothetical protein
MLMVLVELFVGGYWIFSVVFCSMGWCVFNRFVLLFFQIVAMVVMCPLLYSVSCTLRCFHY